MGLLYFFWLHGLDSLRQVQDKLTCVIVSRSVQKRHFIKGATWTPVKCWLGNLVYNDSDDLDRVLRLNTRRS